MASIKSITRKAKRSVHKVRDTLGDALKKATNIDGKLKAERDRLRKKFSAEAERFQKRVENELKRVGDDIEAEINRIPNNIKQLGDSIENAYKKFLNRVLKKITSQLGDLTGLVGKGIEKEILTAAQGGVDIKQLFYIKLFPPIKNIIRPYVYKIVDTVASAANSIPFFGNAASAIIIAAKEKANDYAAKEVVKTFIKEAVKKLARIQRSKEFVGELTDNLIESVGEVNELALTAPDAMETPPSQSSQAHSPTLGQSQGVERQCNSCGSTIVIIGGCNHCHSCIRRVAQ